MCVAVNIRPLIGQELVEGCRECVTVTPGQPQVQSPHHPHRWPIQPVASYSILAHGNSQLLVRESSIKLGKAKNPSGHPIGGNLGMITMSKLSYC